LGRENINKLIDVRLNNISQLAGFSKKPDLEYFLKQICDIDYYHLPELAPTKSILDAYKKEKGSWEQYENDFLELMYKRNIEDQLTKEFIDGSCLLCSEHEPHFCHRRLVAEYLNKNWDSIIFIKHI
jgi:uncharacterized protein (DUF488 family)